MATDELADQARTRRLAVGAIAGNDNITALSTLKVLNVDASDGTFALASGQKRDGNDVYEAMRDERFGFDINHFTAILFVEWKAISDLKRQV